MPEDAGAGCKVLAEQNHMKKANFVIVVTLLASSLFADDANTWGYDNQRTRFSNETGFTNLTQMWKYTTPVFEGSAVPIYSSVATGDGILIACDMRGRVYAFDAAASYFPPGTPPGNASTPVLLWQKQFLNTSFLGAPIIYKGRAILCDREGRIRSLRLKDGEVAWTFDLRSNLDSSPLVVGNTLLVATGIPRNGLVALKLNSNPPEILWSYATNQPSYSSPALYDNGGTKLVLFGNNEAKLTCLDISNSVDTNVDPVFKWEKAYSAGFSRSTPTVVGQNVIVVPGQSEKKVEVLKVTDGSVVFSGSIPGPSNLNYNSGIATDGQSAYFVGGETTQRLYKLDLTANPITLAEINSDLADQGGMDFSASPTLTSQSLIGATTADQSTGDPGKIFYLQNSVYAFTALDGEAYSSPVISNGIAYVCTTAGSIYAFRSANTPPSNVTTGFSPSNDQNVTTDTVTISWASVSDQEDGANVTYIVRIDDDGEILESYDEFMSALGVNSADVPIPLTQNTKWYYSVRVKDQSGAFSGWSSIKSFWYKKVVAAPEPPSNLAALPYDGKVTLSWTASPAYDLTGYKIVWGVVGSLTNTTLVGTVDASTILGLTNGTAYEFRLSALDADGLESTIISATAVPNPTISINGTSYATLDAALAAAMDGQTITLGPGTFAPTAAGQPQAFSMNQGVSIEGYSALHTFVKGMSAQDVIKVQQTASANYSSISNVLIYDGTNGVTVSGAKVKITNCVITQTATAIRTTAPSTIHATNNTLTYNINNGISASDSVMIIRNNIITHNQNGIVNIGNSITGGYNDLFNDLADWVNFVSLAGMLSTDVVFESIPALDFREVAGSATIDKGDPADAWDQEPQPNGGRINMGAFGNTFLAVKGTTVGVPPTSGGGGGSSSGGGGGGGCYVASSTIGKYGFAYVEPYHAVKRAIESVTGNTFMRSYYAVSPPVARVLKKRPVFNRLVTDLLRKKQ